MLCEIEIFIEISISVRKVTAQLVDKPTRSQSSRGLVNSRTSQLAETFDLKFALTKCK